MDGGAFVAPRFFVVDDPVANFHMMLLIPPERARGE
jgi:hypothetical protein